MCGWVGARVQWISACNTLNCIPFSSWFYFSFAFVTIEIWHGLSSMEHFQNSNQLLTYCYGTVPVQPWSSPFLFLRKPAFDFPASFQRRWLFSNWNNSNWKESQSLECVLRCLSFSVESPTLYCCIQRPTSCVCEWYRIRSVVFLKWSVRKSRLLHISVSGVEYALGPFLWGWF